MLHYSAYCVHSYISINTINEKVFDKKRVIRTATKREEQVDDLARSSALTCTCTSLQSTLLYNFTKWITDASALRWRSNTYLQLCPFCAGPITNYTVLVLELFHYLFALFVAVFPPLSACMGAYFLQGLRDPAFKRDRAFIPGSALISNRLFSVTFLKVRWTYDVL